MNKLVLVVLSLLLTQKMLGQISYGLKGGLNVSNARIKEYTYDKKSKLGLHAGGYFEFAALKNLSIKTEVLYSGKGLSHLVTPDGSYAKKKFDYISVPVLLSIPINRKIHFLAGPEISVLLSATSTYEGTTYDYKPMSKIDKAVDLGLHYILTNKLGLELLYSYGLNGSEIRRYVDGNGNVIKEEKISANRAIQFGLTYNFQKNK